MSAEETTAADPKAASIWHVDRTARGGRFDLEHTRIGLRMVRALDLDERRVAAVIAHEHERSRIRRVSRNQLGDARGAINVPD